MTTTQYSLDSWGDPAAIANGQRDGARIRERDSGLHALLINEAATDVTVSVGGTVVRLAPYEVRDVPA